MRTVSWRIRSYNPDPLRFSITFLRYAMSLRRIVSSSSAVARTRIVFMHLKNGEKNGVSPNRYSHLYTKKDPSNAKCANGYVATKPFLSVCKHAMLRKRRKKWPYRCSVFELALSLVLVLCTAVLDNSSTVSFRYVSSFSFRYGTTTCNNEHQPVSCTQRNQHSTTAAMKVTTTTTATTTSSCTKNIQQTKARVSWLWESMQTSLAQHCYQPQPAA